MEHTIVAFRSDQEPLKLAVVRPEIASSTLVGFEWAHTPLQQAQSEQLAASTFMETAHNLILVGGTGTGKSHLATAIGVEAIHHGKRVRFFNAVDLVNALEREKSLGKIGNLAKQLCLMDAIIIDELGYLPFPASGWALLFHLISQLYEKTSLIINHSVTTFFQCRQFSRHLPPKEKPPGCLSASKLAWSGTMDKFQPNPPHLGVSWGMRWLRVS